MSNAEVPFAITLISGGNTIGELVDISGPNETADDIDVTSFDSDDQYREYVRGLIDGGDVSISANGYYDNYSTAKALFNSTTTTTPYTNTISIVNGDIVEHITYSGYINSLGISNAVGDKMTMEVGYKVSGKPTLSTSSAV